jgi:hypothetical protein
VAAVARVALWMGRRLLLEVDVGISGGVHRIWTHQRLFLRKRRQTLRPPHQPRHQLRALPYPWPKQRDRHPEEEEYRLRSITIITLIIHTRGSRAPRTNDPCRLQNPRSWMRIVEFPTKSLSKSGKRSEKRGRMQRISCKWLVILVLRVVAISAGWPRRRNFLLGFILLDFIGSNQFFCTTSVK